MTRTRQIILCSHFGSNNGFFEGQDLHHQTPPLQPNHSMTAIVRPFVIISPAGQSAPPNHFRPPVFIELLADDLGLSHAKEDAELRGSSLHAKLLLSSHNIVCGLNLEIQSVRYEAILKHLWNAGLARNAMRNAGAIQPRAGASRTHAKRGVPTVTCSQIFQ